MDTDRDILATVAHAKYCDNFNVTLENDLMNQKQERPFSQFTANNNNLNDKSIILDKSKFFNIDMTNKKRVSDLLSSLAKDLKLEITSR